MDLLNESEDLIFLNVKDSGKTLENLSIVIIYLIDCLENYIGIRAYW